MEQQKSLTSPEQQDITRKPLEELTHNPFHRIVILITAEEEEKEWEEWKETGVMEIDSITVPDGILSNGNFLKTPQISTIEPRSHHIEERVNDCFGARIMNFNKGRYPTLYEQELQLIRTYIKNTAPSKSPIIKYFNELPIPEELMEKLMIDPNKNLVENLATLNDEDLCSFIEWNFNYVCGEEIKFESKVEESINEFITTLEKFKVRYKLPINMDDVKKRINSLTYSFIDPIRSDQINISGLHDGNNSHMSILLNPECITDMKDTVYHELLHHISGFVVVTDINDINLSIRNFPNRWINEAITEQISQILLNFDDKFNLNKVKTDTIFKKYNKGVYLEYRSLLRSLLYGDLYETKFITVIKAYFENFYDDLTIQDKYPYSNDLYDQIKHSYLLDVMKLLFETKYPDEYPTKARRLIENRKIMQK